MNKKMVVEKINKFKRNVKEIGEKVRIGLYVLPEIVLVLASVGCTETNADGISKQDPIEQNLVIKTPKVSSSSMPIITPEATPTPTAIPTSTPQMTREEALKKLNITSKELCSLADLVIYDCTLADGSNCKFLTREYYKASEQKGFFDIKVVNVTDGVTFATFSTDSNELSQNDTMDKVDITLVPTFLQGATINTTYGLSSMPWLFDPKTLPASNKFMKMILDAAEEYNTTGNSSKMLETANIYLNATECANLLLDIGPYESMPWASYYVNDPAIQETPKVK